MALNKIVLSDGVTELANVKSVTYKEVVNAGVGLRPGCVGSAQIEVEVYGNQAGAVAAGEVVSYYQIDAGGNETLMGLFTAEPSIKTKNSYKFLAYDNAQKLDADFSQWLRANQANFPMTVYALVSAACTVAGVTLGSASWPLSTQTVNAFYADGITCRDILSYAAEIGCRFVRCHTDGAIYFDWYAATTNTIGPSVGTNQYAYKQNGLTYANYTAESLARVAVHPSGEDDVAYIYPDGVTSGNTLHIKNNLLLTGADATFYNAVAQNVYSNISTLFPYRPFSVRLFPGENPFRAGMVVSAVDIQGVQFSAPVMSMSVTSAAAELESTGNVTLEDSEVTAKELVQLASDIVRINKLKVDWADINQAIINYLTANNVTAQNLTIVDENGNVLATYDAAGIVLGDADKAHAELDLNTFSVIDKDGNAIFAVGDSRGADGLTDVVITEYEFFRSTPFINLVPNASSVDTIHVFVNGTEITPQGVSVSSIWWDDPPFPEPTDVIRVEYKTAEPYWFYTLGTRDTTDGSGYFSATIGKNNKATAANALSAGGSFNAAEGVSSATLGGDYNTARGGESVAAGGQQNEALADQSAVVGGISASNDGVRSVILGGEGLKTHGRSQVAFGEYNLSTRPSGTGTIPPSYVRTMLETVGNGTSDSARSNARTLDWQGNEVLAGDLTINGNISITDLLFYKVNDTDSMPSIVCPGFITSSAQTVHLGLETEKSMENVSTITVTSLTGGIRGPSGYVDGSGNSFDWLNGNYTVTALKRTNHKIDLRITKTAGAMSNVSNNVSLAFWGTIGLKFT